MIGRTLTHYKVVEELGAGGMGVVYKALDLRLDRHVALKILPPDKSDEHDRRSRFLHEARAASALNDPHIVTIFDIFTDEGTDVLVMELVPGRTLRHILDDGPLDVARAVEIAVQVAEGVGVAHSAGIVHRDLKPGNVMVTERGRVKVLDFGLAKLVSPSSLAERPTTMAPTTIAGMLLGTVDYMSPEQAQGNPIDGRSDIFSLGAMLYEMLTGARPFVANHPLGVLHEIVYGAIVPPRSTRAEISPAIEAVVLKALERDPALRFSSMESFASGLRDAQRSPERREQPVATPPLPIIPPPLPRQSPPQRTVVADKPFNTTLPEPITLSGTSSPPASPTSSPWDRAFEPLEKTMRDLATKGSQLGAATRAQRAARKVARRTARGTARRGSRWTGFIVVMAVLYGFNWMRHLGDPTSSRPRPPVAGQSRPSNGGDNLGPAIEDGVATLLDNVGPNTPGIQLARAKIFWKRAQKNQDSELRQKAEDAFNRALSLKPNAKDEAEAREGLREIQASKEPTTGP